jgi:hypothetical protein
MWMYFPMLYLSIGMSNRPSEEKLRTLKDLSHDYLS